MHFFFDFFGPWKKCPGMAPNGASKIFVPTNPDLADILGRTDSNFENFYFGDFLDSKFLDFQVPRFPEIWAWPGLRGSSATAPDHKVGEIQGKVICSAVARNCQKLYQQASGVLFSL